MLNQASLQRIEQLQQRLRVLILQNAREEDEYDERFLKELKTLSEEILRLKKGLSVRSFTGQAATRSMYLA